MYLQQINEKESFEGNIKRTYLKVTSYLYEEALLLLRQEVQEPGVYSAIIEAIASGYTKANEISTKIGEDSAKCLKYIKTLCELGILHKETPFGEKKSSRKTIYGISDFMFRFWYRYVFANRTLIETGAQQAVWERRIKPDYYSYMGLVFEKVCMDYLNAKNAKGELPILYTSIGRWWGTNAATHGQEEIDLIANDGKDYLFGECKWRNESIEGRDCHMIDYDIIASRIKEARKYKKKISQKKMAEDLNMYQPDLSALENNKPGCGIRDLAKLEMIAGYLNISLGYLLFGEGEEMGMEDFYEK